MRCGRAWSDAARRDSMSSASAAFVREKRRPGLLVKTFAPQAPNRLTEVKTICAGECDMGAHCVTPTPRFWKRESPEVYPLLVRSLPRASRFSRLPALVVPPFQHVLLPRKEKAGWKDQHHRLNIVPRSDTRYLRSQATDCVT